MWCIRWQTYLSFTSNGNVKKRDIGITNISINILHHMIRNALNNMFLNEIVSRNANFTMKLCIKYCYGMVLQFKLVFDISYQRIAHEMEIVNTN